MTQHIHCPYQPKQSPSSGQLFVCDGSSLSLPSEHLYIQFIDKKPAVASRMESKVETASHHIESRYMEGQGCHPLHPDLPPVVLTCLATGSGRPRRESEADDLCNSAHFL